MNLTAALLAGGKSTRMGRDKALLEIEGVPLWSRQWTLLSQLHAQKLVVSARTRPAWCPDAMEVVKDASYDCGPIGGLAAVAANCATTHFLTLAIDMPCMTLEHLHKLCSLVEPEMGVCSVYEGRYEPLCAIYSTAACKVIEQQIALGEFALQALVHQLVKAGMMRVLALAPKERVLYANLNTPEDASHFAEGNG